MEELINIFHPVLEDSFSQIFVVASIEGTEVDTSCDVVSDTISVVCDEECPPSLDQPFPICRRGPSKRNRIKHTSQSSSPSCNERLPKCYSRY